jgi:hypothetical protein
MAILPKTDNGWKLCVGSNIQRIAQIVHEDTLVFFYKYRNTDDYYVYASNIYETPMDISDSLKSCFQELSEYRSKLDEYAYSYYAYVPRIVEDYVIMADGQNIPFDEAAIRVSN